ncbi:MAG TPA: hypothetical protein VF120_06340 [Ktedonobacterales bacterium]
MHVYHDVRGADDHSTSAMERVAHVGRWLLSALLAAHGMMHVLGFVVIWHLGPLGALLGEPTYAPGRVEQTPFNLFLGLLWLVAGASFVVAAAGLMAARLMAARLMAPAWWRPLTLAAVVLSLALCITSWDIAWLAAPAWYAAAAIDLLLLCALLYWLPAMQETGETGETGGTLTR